nr:zinc finger BED domain-containing protein RICESLEEPER 2-like [Ipomoea batatas]
MESQEMNCGNSSTPIDSSQPLMVVGGLDTNTPLETPSPINSPKDPPVQNDELELPTDIATKCEVNIGDKRLKSIVWQHFKKVKVDGLDKAECNYCKKLLGGQSKNGTKHLHDHHKMYDDMRRFGISSFCQLKCQEFFPWNIPHDFARFLVHLVRYVNQVYAYFRINLTDISTLWKTIQLKIIIELHKSPDNWFVNVKPPALVSYSYVNIWIHLDSIHNFVLHSNSHLEYWMMHINGLFWCQQYRHQSERELIIKLQVTHYELEPACSATIISGRIRYGDPFEVQIGQLFRPMIHNRNPNSTQLNSKFYRRTTLLHLALYLRASRISSFCQRRAPFIWR